MLKTKYLSAFYVPVLFGVLLWIIKLLEVSLEQKWYVYGLKPHSWTGLMGIVTAPLLHGSFSHLISNTFPLIILGGGVFYLYRKIAVRVCLYIYVLTGFLVWNFSSNHNYHIGASGLVYGFAAFLFLSGILRKHRGLMAISLLIAFLYGGLIWGVLPGQMGISWESHLMGAISGIVFSIAYRDVKMEIEETEEEKIIEIADYSQLSFSDYYDNHKYILKKSKTAFVDPEEIAGD